MENKNECPLGVEEEIGESKTLSGVANVLSVRPLKGGEYKRYGTMIKRLSEIGFPMIDMGDKRIDEMNISLEVLTQKSNAIVSSYKTNERGDSVDPANKNIKRQSKHDFTQQPRKVCPCSLNDDFRVDSMFESPKCFMVLERNSNPSELKHIATGSLCKVSRPSTIWGYNQLKTYHTKAVLNHYWKILNIPTLGIVYGDFDALRNSKLNLRVNQNGDEWSPSFYSNNKDFRSNDKHSVLGHCTDCNKDGFQCVTKAKKENRYPVVGEMQINTLDYWGWKDETFDMVALRQSWNQPKYLMNLETKEILSVDEWSRKGAVNRNYKCRETWAFTVAQFIGRVDANGNYGTRYGWVKFLKTEEMMSSLDSINGRYSDMPLFEDVSNGGY